MNDITATSSSTATVSNGDTTVTDNETKHGSSASTSAIAELLSDSPSSITSLTGKHAIIGSADDDILVGTAGNDLINGREGNDRLSGGNGYDVLIGGSDTDTLVGGGDADTFILEAEVASPFLADQIVDFNHLEGDKIGLANGLEFDDLTLQAFDSDSNGITDATSIRLGPNADDPVLGVVLGTVDSAGKTTLTSADFISA